MRIFQLRIRKATPNYAKVQLSNNNRYSFRYIWNCECICVYVCSVVYNKTQIQMAFYATCPSKPCADKEWSVVERGWLHSLKHVSHVFHYVTTNCLTRAANNGNDGHRQLLLQWPNPSPGDEPCSNFKPYANFCWEKRKVKAELMRVNKQCLLTEKSN